MRNYCHAHIIPDGFKDISRMARYIKFACRTYFTGTGKTFVINCYIFCNLLICYMHLLTHYYCFCVQLQLSSQIDNRNTQRGNFIAITMRNVWIFPQILWSICCCCKNVVLLKQAWSLLSGFSMLSLVKNPSIKYFMG